MSMRRYTLADLHAAEREFSQAKVVLLRKECAQAKERGDIAKACARLEKSISPLRERVRWGEEEYQKLLRRRLGAWDVEGQRERWLRGTIRVFDGSKDWWNTRAWLRVVSRDHRQPEWQWTVTFYDHAYSLAFAPDEKDIVFGPPTENPKEDFRKHCLTVEKKLEVLGFILTKKLED